MPSDAPVNFKIGGTYDMPWGIVFSTNFQHASGYPEYASYSVTSSNLPAGQTLVQGSQTVYVQPSGFQRLPSVNIWDVRFAKIFKFRERYQIQPEFDIYNLNNSSAVTSVNQSVNSALYLNPTNVINGRLLKVGIKIDF